MKRTLVILLATCLTYVALTSVEAIRLWRVEGAIEAGVGFHDWERARRPPRGTAPFRWSKARAGITDAIYAPVVRIPLFSSRPDDLGEIVRVAFDNGSARLATLELQNNGWTDFLFYLPPLYGGDWVRLGIGATAGPGAPAVVAGAEAQVDTAWQELQPWSPRPPTLQLSIAVSPTFVPGEVMDTDDARVLGIGVGELAWTAELPAEGLGFHGVEVDADGRAFRWTSRLWASQPLQPAGRAVSLDLLASHPDLAQRPVVVHVYWNERCLESLEITRAAWTTVDIDLGAATAAPGVLTVEIDRTWNPAREGASDDTRTLGVALSDVTWR